MYQKEVTVKKMPQLSHLNYQGNSCSKTSSVTLKKITIIKPIWMVTKLTRRKERCESKLRKCQYQLRKEAGAYAFAFASWAGLLHDKDTTPNDSK